MAAMDGFDLLIAGGTIVDGTGAPGFPGAVGVRDGRLRVLRDPDAIAAAASSSARIIDAGSSVVAPGFIDLHSHSGLMILAEPRHEPKVRQGVTTEVIGVDGNAYAPFPSAADLAAFVELNAGLDGHPPGVAIDWDTVPSYLERFDGWVSVNIAFLVGNAPLRIAALGWEETVADARAVDHMRALLREGMEAGAYGVSSGLDYPPGSCATTSELAALANEAGRLGGIYHTHVRYPLGDGFLDPFREAIEIGRRGEAPAHITHFYHRATFPGTPDQMLALVDDARAEGLDVTFDAYPYEWASSRLLVTIPTWVQAGGARGIADIRLGYFARPEHVRWEGRTLGEIGRETGEDLVELLCDLLLAEGLRLNQVTPGPNMDGIRRFYRHPVAMVGTDSTFVGAKPSP